ncbi:MerR family transcriptional regulator [Solibacillus sp. CAU 1738]|uniref:MerR family transcriptional regulator n=1 Tax=Solibacillus sp. CAU 1738 TaxID=3140363 RepID=UPI003261B7ED
MKIGNFIEKAHTTRDTVRHYEELGLLRPAWINNLRDYTAKDLADFQAIKEMQGLGLALKDIQVIFQVKRDNGCNSVELLSAIILKLNNTKTILQLEQQEITAKLANITNLITGINELKK